MSWRMRNARSWSSNKVGCDVAMNGQNELISILARRAHVIAWAYDARTDCLAYWSPQKTDFSQIESLKKSGAASEWKFLWEEQATGCVDVHAPDRMDGALFRLTFKRLERDRGVVGFAEPLSEPMGAAAIHGRAICDENALTARIDADMLLLRAREKGVMFALGIDGFGKGNLASASQKNKCYEIMEATMRAEFRDSDIFGLISDARYIVFFRGALSIDVVEQRAQRFLDEFSRRALDNTLPISCSIGIAVQGREQASAKQLIAYAGQALDDVTARGTNRYRMFESEKY